MAFCQKKIIFPDEAHFDLGGFRRSQHLNISETSLRRILHKDIGMAPYKVQLVQELKTIDHPMRLRLAKWAYDRLTKMPILVKKITLSDEAHFDLDGYVNKPNFLIWGTENQNGTLFGADFGPKA